LHPVFSSLDAATIICLHIKVVSIASNSQPGEPCPIFMSPYDRASQLYT
jgi:hypothetical protein